MLIGIIFYQIHLKVEALDGPVIRSNRCTEQRNGDRFSARATTFRDQRYL